MAAYRTTAEALAAPALPRTAPMGANTAAGFAATRGSAPPPSSAFPGVPMTAAAYPPLTPPLPPTQTSWQPPVEPNRAGGGAAPIYFVLGVCAVGLVGIVGIAAGMLLRTRRSDVGTAQPAGSVAAPANTDTPGAAPAASTPGAPKKAGASPLSTPTSTTTAPAAKDAGAAPTATAKKDDDLEAKKRLHTAFCAHNQSLLSQPNVSDATLHQVVNGQCLPGNGPDGSRCERANCRQACAALHDAGCLQRVEFADQTFPAKY
jgi:hypothetical protein